MSELLAQFLAFAERHWRSPPMLIAGPFLVGVAVLLLVTGTASRWPTPLGWILGTTLAFATALLWLWTNRIPRVRKGKVGFVVGITSDKEHQHARVRDDFCGRLRHLLEEDPKGGNFDLVVLPGFVSKKLVSLDVVDKILRKARGHFLIYGQVRLRRIKGEETHYLSLHGAVRHGAVSSEMRSDLAQEFGQVIPRSVVIRQDNDVFAFEATSEWLDVSARYVIGVAAYLSGDVAYTERLLLDVENKLRRTVPKHRPLRLVSQRLPRRFCDLYTSWLTFVVDEYISSRDEKWLPLQEDLSDKLLARDPRSYAGLLSKAICQFMRRRDVAGALQTLRRCRRQPDVTWRYSMAFLYAYQNDLARARVQYQKAFRGPLNNPTVPIQCEEFIYLVLEQEPDMGQLYYCSALINQRAKDDPTGANRDFQRFLNWDGSAQHPKERQESLMAIEEQS